MNPEYIEPASPLATPNKLGINELDREVLRGTYPIGEVGGVTLSKAEQVAAFRNRRRLKICERNLKRQATFNNRMAARDKAGELVKNDERIAWGKGQEKAGKLSYAVAWLKEQLL